MEKERMIGETVSGASRVPEVITKTFLRRAFQVGNSQTGEQDGFALRRLAGPEMNKNGRRKLRYVIVRKLFGAWR